MSDIHLVHRYFFYIGKKISKWTYWISPGWWWNLKNVFKIPHILRLYHPLLCLFIWEFLLCRQLLTCNFYGIPLFFKIFCTVWSHTFVVKKSPHNSQMYLYLFPIFLVICTEARLKNYALGFVCFLFRYNPICTTFLFLFYQFFL